MAYKQQKLISHRSGSPRARCQHGRGLVRALFQVADRRLLVVPSCGRRMARDLCVNPCTRAQDPIHSQRPHLLGPSHLRLERQPVTTGCAMTQSLHWEWWRCPKQSSSRLEPTPSFLVYPPQVTTLPESRFHSHWLVCPLSPPRETGP